ncbi:unnamed protein product [Bursaphelenchus okinawaensis]|uniref:Uncharacterized protein n=1 Tax=Bursaphelenchus okinawaensis TaxID=465554 RepID=A0A811KBL9_9BILA|nr:unnamed protein product [Bursaphelenchus okinawaensis]CAG9098033.1 unnamed protein product [Bursaphelenchus okinawaensis]
MATSVKDLYQLSVSLKYDQKIVNVERYSFKKAEDHIILLIRACISEETCQNTIKNLVIIEKKVNKMIKQADSVSGVRVSNFVVIRIDVIELLNLNVKEEAAEISWEDEEKLCEEAKKAAELLDHNPMALQLRILRSVEQNGKQNYNLVMPMTANQPEVYGHQTAHSIIGDFTRRSSYRYQRIYMSPPHTDPIYDRIV